MTEHVRKRAEELAEDAYANVSNYRDMPSDARIAMGGYRKAMLQCLPIIERINKGGHDDGCSSREVVPYTLMPCNCTLAWAREEARKLVGG